MARGRTLLHLGTSAAPILNILLPPLLGFQVNAQAYTFICIKLYIQYCISNIHNHLETSGWWLLLQQVVGVWCCGMEAWRAEHFNGLLKPKELKEAKEPISISISNCSIQQRCDCDEEGCEQCSGGAV